MVGTLRRIALHLLSVYTTTSYPDTNPKTIPRGIPKEEPTGRVLRLIRLHRTLRSVGESYQHFLKQVSV